MQLGGIVGPAHGHMSIAIAHRRLIVGSDGEQMRLDGEKQLLGVGHFLFAQRIERVAERFQRAADGGELIIVHRDAAGEIGLGEIEELLPGSGGFLRLLGVDDEPGGAPILQHRIGHAIDGAGAEEARVLGARVIVRQQLEVDRFDQIELLVGGDRVVGGHEHVPSGGAGLQLRQHFLVGSEDRHIDLHAGLGGEIIEVRLREIVGPGHEVESAGKVRGSGFARAQARHGAGHNGGGDSEARNAQEVAAGDGALPVAAQFLEKFLRGDGVDRFFHCFSPKLSYVSPRRARGPHRAASPPPPCRRFRKRRCRLPPDAGSAP